jgi:hypothetical protein
LAGLSHLIVRKSSKDIVVVMVVTVPIFASILLAEEIYKGRGVVVLHHTFVVVSHSQRVPKVYQKAVVSLEMPDIVSQRRNVHRDMCSCWQIAQHNRLGLRDLIEERVAHICSMDMRMVRVRFHILALEYSEKVFQDTPPNKMIILQDLITDDLQNMSLLMFTLDGIERPVTNIELVPQPRH